MHFLFPGSLRMFRLVPALAHAVTVVLVAATARRVGGGKWAETVAALCVSTGGVFLGIGTTLSTGALEPLAGLFCAYALIRIIPTMTAARGWRWVAPPASRCRRSI
jgi:dolichyl-phosphate-mannose--protein O-mannosyl transferase